MLEFWTTHLPTQCQIYRFINKIYVHFKTSMLGVHWNNMMLNIQFCQIYLPKS